MIEEVGRGRRGVHFFFSVSSSPAFRLFFFAAESRALLVRVSLLRSRTGMERRASALQRHVLLPLLLLALAVECLASSPTPSSTRRASTITSTLPSSSQASSPFVAGATFTISSPEAFVTPEQQSALEAALPACIGLSASDEDEEAAPTTTIKTSSTTSAACG